MEQKKRCVWYIQQYPERHDCACNNPDETIVGFFLDKKNALTESDRLYEQYEQCYKQVKRLASSPDSPWWGYLCIEKQWHYFHILKSVLRDG